MPPTHNELPMVMEIEEQTMLHLWVTFILPPLGFGTTAKHFPSRFLGLGVTKLSPLFWHSMVFTQHLLWEMLRSNVPLYCWVSTGRTQTRRFKDCSKVAVKEVFVQVSQNWWWFHFRVVHLSYLKNTSIFGCSISLWRTVHTHPEHALTHIFTLQSTVLLARRGGYVANI